MLIVVELVAMIFIVNDNILRFMLLSLALYFIYANFEAIILTDDVIYSNGRADSWDNLRKWAYDDKKNSLVLVLNIDGKDQQRLLPVKSEDKDEIMAAIKKFKKKE